MVHRLYGVKTSRIDMAIASQAMGTIVLNVESGLVKGSGWFLAGNLGPLAIRGDKLGLKKSVEVTIDLSKLASWTFPTEADPREAPKSKRT